MSNIQVHPQLMAIDSSRKDTVTRPKSHAWHIEPYSRNGFHLGYMAKTDVLGVMDGQGVADFGTIDDHKETMAAVLGASTAAFDVATATDATAAPKTEHAHTHAHGEPDPDCEVCQEEAGEKAEVASSSHSHSHAHGDHTDERQEYDPDCAQCNDESHGHVSGAVGVSGSVFTEVALVMLLRQSGIPVAYFQCLACFAFNTVCAFK